ncbi:MAG: riboflavin synthase [Candidatus Omnitrophota bacterium]
MFTGIVEEIGTVKRLVSKENLAILVVQATKISKGVRLGSSICVNGVCLTVTAVEEKNLIFDAMAETLEKTTLGKLKSGDKVNLERAVKSSGRLDGHIVTGHVDQVSMLIKRIAKENYLELRFSLDHLIARFIAPKGSICINGVSLTVGAVTKEYFSVYIIPLTEKETNLGLLKEQMSVNIEVDILARYIERQMADRR